ncbi:isochorismatase family protein [Streptomyces sp. YU58]|uniref:isochorismatase family protein n=1 Tax=Streptomyces sp. SX92 TaxID=3158972 RepID=UPI0027B90195|nr:isochorismatase family protein [Streptomyces coralus]WLW52456.1 isochorismatase family protein [Streptomyces coralus]
MPIPDIEPYPLPTEDELPPARVGWRLEAARSALLIHDMQQYFVDFLPAGSELRDGLIRRVAELREAAAAAGVPVYFTAQPGGMTRGERGLLHDFWGPGMKHTGAHKRILPELRPEPPAVVLTKWRYSAFARSPLAELLAGQGRDQLIICGVYAHVGILMTACDAFTRDIQPFVVADAIADFSAADHAATLDYLARRCALPVMTHEVVSRLALPARQDLELLAAGRQRRPPRTPPVPLATPPTAS